MDLKQFNPYLISVYKCRNFMQILDAIRIEFEKYRNILPNSKDAVILLKPNLNSNMNSLTGNTTDLRVLSSVIEVLREYGYKKIIIGEGTSSGFYRNEINIFSRLKVDRLARYYNVGFLDLNYAPYKEVLLENGIKAYIAEICFKTDFFINIPKVKMHFETMMSTALKNLVGCMVGLGSKQKVHYSLFRNIINLNKYIKVDLHIVDGLICMEGTGPSKGAPIKMDTVLIGRNPYVIDLACAELTGLNFWEVPVLKEAYSQALFSDEHINYIKSLNLSAYKKNFKKPKVNLLVKFVNNQRWQKYFIRLRLSPFFNFLCSLNIIGKLLNYTGLRQDAFIMEDDKIEDITLNSRCNRCGICSGYCPLPLKLPDEVGYKNKGCLLCLYCYFICPQNAIDIKGDFGFLREQIKQYNSLIKNLESREHD